MSKKVMIVSGGPLEEEFALEYIRGRDVYLIAVDRGLKFFYRHKEELTPDYIVGDFDSIDEEIAEYYRHQTDVPIREFNPVKDASDTEIAIRLGMALGCKEMDILGATGGRIDHLWANVQTLVIPHKAGVLARIIDSRNCIYLIGNETTLRIERMYGKYFSLFPLGCEVEGLCITGAKYPLNDHLLTAEDSLCVSNQFGEGEKEVEIRYSRGLLILMETKD